MSTPLTGMLSNTCRAGLEISRPSHLQWDGREIAVRFRNL